MKTESIRKNIEALKKESEVILSSKNISAEVQLFIRSMMSILEILITIFLEKKTRKNSSNSGLAPSRNNGTNGNRNKSSKHQPKLAGEIPNTKKTELLTNVSEETCAHCNKKLKNAKVLKTEIRKKLDLVYEVVEESFVGETKQCQCGYVNPPSFPSGIEGEVQYGNGIKSTIINFLMVQMMSLERVQEHLHGLLGRLISQTTMLKYVMQFYLSLEQWELQEVEKILSAPTIHCDETSLRVNKKTMWIHSYSSGETTLLFLHEKRGVEAMEEVGILSKYKGIIVHDCWQSYLSYKNTKHALCGGHLLRELKFIEDSTKFKWATEMKLLLKEACLAVGKRKSTKILTKKEYEKLEKTYAKILKAAKKEMPPPLESQGKRGRIAQTGAQNLLDRLERYKDSILLFAKVKEVDFTNNRAERDLRVTKTKEKVAGCFRKIEYAKCFCRITSYIKSMRYRGYSALEAIALAIEGKIPS